jgi:hypothetical protein
MTVNEILNAAQSLSFEERKALIKGLFERMPKAGELAGSVVEAGDLEAGTRQIRELVSQSLGRTAKELQDDGEGGG